MSQSLGHSTPAEQEAELLELRQRNNFLEQELTRMEALLTAERNRFEEELRVERRRSREQRSQVMAELLGHRVGTNFTERRRARDERNQLMGVIRGQIDHVDRLRGTLEANYADLVESQRRVDRATVSPSNDTDEGRELSGAPSITHSPSETPNSSHQTRGVSIELGGAPSVAHNSSRASDSPRQQARSASVELGDDYRTSRQEPKTLKRRAEEMENFEPGGSAMANRDSSEDDQVEALRTSTHTGPTSRRRTVLASTAPGTSLPEAPASRDNSTRPAVGTTEPWTVEQFMDPNFRPNGLPDAIVDMARSQITAWNSRNFSWTEGKKWRCAANVLRKKPATWLDGKGEHACDFCERNGRLCIAVKEGEIKVLPLVKKGREDISRVDIAFWVEI